MRAKLSIQSDIPVLLLTCNCKDAIIVQLLLEYSLTADGALIPRRQLRGPFYST